MTNTPHIAIVGAGFGGLEVAEQLAHVPVEVTLIDRHNYHTFQPLLYQVATSLLNAEDVGAPVRSMFRHQENLTFRMATVTGVDIAGRTIHLEDGNQLAYDYLVLAGGATVNYFNTPGAAEHAFPLYTLMNAVKLRNHILDRFEAADRDPSLTENGALNFVIVGAGPTGVETAGALADLFYNLLPQDYHQLATAKARVVIVEMAKEVLAPFKEDLRTYAKEELERRHVEVRLGEAVAEVGATFVRLKVLPQLGSVAMQSGQHVGRQIARRLHGESTQPFKYWDKGFMATIGRYAAVVQFPNQRTLHGHLAYFAWLGVHLTLLSGIRNRIEVLWNWSWSALTHDRAARIIIEPKTDDVKVGS
jgi:NADH dehydrogenase FAD-containing subunit